MTWEHKIIILRFGFFPIINSYLTHITHDRLVQVLTHSEFSNHSDVIFRRAACFSEPKAETSERKIKVHNNIITYTRNYANRYYIYEHIGETKCRIRVTFLNRTNINRVWIFVFNFIIIIIFRIRYHLSRTYYVKPLETMLSN